MPAGYVRAWLSMEEAIDHVMRVAECGRQEARDALVQAILDGEIRSRFGDDGLQDIKAFLWQHARQWAPYSGLGAKAANRARISGDAAYLRPFFDPPTDPALLPERLRPVEVRREDVDRLWPVRPGSQDEDRRAIQQTRRKWRSECIARFAERQRIARRWIALIDLVDWCAQSTTAASDDEEARAREVAYRRLTESVRHGEFERDGRSKLLYLDALVTADGASPRCRLTREQFEIAFDVAAMPPAPSLPLTVLNCCWLPSDMARRWLESHGYRWAPHFEPPARAISDFDLRLGWIPLARALEIIGTAAWKAVKKAIQHEAVRARCRVDGIMRDLRPHWLNFLAFDRPDEDVLWFDREKVWRARTQDASLEPVPDRASEIVLSLAQCRELWPNCAWPKSGHPPHELGHQDEWITTAEFFRHFTPSRGRASSAGPEHIRTEPANAKPEGGPERAGEDDALSHSGFPGRPSKGRHLIEDEFRCRMNAGKTLASVADEAAVLLEWLIDTHPKMSRPTVKTIENNIRAIHRQWQANRSAAMP
jgi:hypothetical protein